MMGLIAWWRRRRALQQPFEASWRDILRVDVPFYASLDEAARARFETKLKVFLRTKYFLPAGGMTIDDRVRVVISAAAARLTMNLPGEHLARLTEIVVYPSHYVHDGEAGAVVFGEAHRHGTVVLSWDAVVGGMTNPDDGHDTALHEFAHVLDVNDGQFDGTPMLTKRAAYSPWARVMSVEFLGLRGKRQRGKRHVLREYGATNEAEFFAVATEAFFEKPHQMKKKHPELYAVLAEYFNADPAGPLDQQSDHS
jgi:Mlc titration factor MtfA (ptsG expression regulator)